MIRPLLISFLFLLSCAGTAQMNVAEIESGHGLERARESSVAEFFERRMSNKPRKANVGSWEILHTTDDFVYYGYPVFASLLSGARGVEILYRVDRKALSTGFPGYAQVTGLQIKSALFDALQNENCELRDVQAHWKTKLEKDRIIVAISCVNRPARYRAEFSSTDGSITSVVRSDS